MGCRAILAAVLCLGTVAFAADPEFRKDGQLLRPKNYREWIYLSTGLGMSYNQEGSAPAAAPRFDNVFVEPSAYRKFLETGQWPDKTVFALEIRQSASKGSIIQQGRYQSDLASVEVAVKDVKRFPDGWAYFGFNGAAATAPAFGPSAGCNACHSRNAAVEHTFVQFYPTLLGIARAKGRLRPSYLSQEPTQIH